MNRAEDPVLVSARREALIVFCIWLAAMTYTVTACWAWGYGRDPATIRFVLGFPDWVFWGIICPWLVCFGISYLFSHVIMRDEALGEDVGDQWEDEFGEEKADA
jgi:fatty acid desaturase